MKTDNELIAEFMGAERREGQRAFNPDEKLIQWIIKGNPYNQHRDDILHWYQPVELKYHESWDWLMPVVEKINTLDLPNVEIRIERFRTTYTTQGCFLLHFYNKQCGGTMGATHKAVTSFIKWYNDSVLIEREKE